MQFLQQFYHFAAKRPRDFQNFQVTSIFHIKRFHKRKKHLKPFFSNFQKKQKIYKNSRFLKNRKKM